MERGKIRRDLYYRLNVLDIRLPPLRERFEDIAPLFEGFVRDCAMRDGDRAPSRPPDFFLEALRAHDWPGNVRELENVAEKWTVLRRLLDAGSAAHLALESFAALGAATARTGDPEGVGDAAISCDGSLDEIASRAVRTVLEEEDGQYFPCLKAARY